MTAYTWPTSSAYCPATFTSRLVPNARVVPAMFAGDDQTIEFPGAKWSFLLSMPNGGSDDRAALEAFLNRVRGPAHRIDIWHLRRPLPRGTLQTNTTLSEAAAQFAATLKINATTGRTLFAGDMVGVTLENSDKALVQVVQDATSSAGVIQVNVTPPLKWSAVASATVTLVRPMARCRLVESVAVTYVPGYSPGPQIELVEV